MKLHAAEVIENQRHGDHVHLRCQWPGVPPQPGQFVMVREEADSLDPFLSRPFFAHDYEEGVIDLLIVVGGRGTAILSNAPMLRISDPIGHGFSSSANGPVALIGGGVWVSPLRLLARSLESQDIAHDIYLEVPPDSSNDYRGFLLERFPQAILVDTGNESNAAHDLVLEVGDLSRYDTLYVSGEPETLVAAKTATAGIVSAQLAVRERMACANGSCFGCAVPVRKSGGTEFVRACVEGPVFEAAELAW